MKQNSSAILDNVYAKDFEALQLSIGASEKAIGLEVSKPILNGQFRYHAFQNGLSMHSVNATEQQDASNAIELPPGLSINFIFSGIVEFEFAQQSHTLQPIDDEASCSVIVNSRQEVMKRRMKKGEYVEKLNIFVELPWLESRCQSSIDRKNLNSLLSRTSVLSWTPTKQTQKKAKRLLKLDQAMSFMQVMHAEQLTIEILTQCLNDLNNRIEPHNDAATQLLNDHSLRLKAAINEHLEVHNTVGDVASALNMSERTLQRKFQRHYGECISSYIKQRKMEHAKVALLINRKTVGEAAYIAGYKHTPNFINAFKKLTGMTPSAFVRSNQEQIDKKHQA
ncbi:AraC family transcriptional regulator [Arenicella xantha]|uniref:AraC family transcriptional regulator n=1 Tax=Arenicella xantha TaxID=644221 RepID=A0A395JM38_9GAMM|nr:AraC family transcriptional regulator [Arenicella xantha]RBP50728.1 AraC family transcriptional regulator [Arenicella xantha]